MKTAAPKFTPGPWCESVATGEEGDIYSGGATLVATVKHPADARLIAAAPELYEALRVLMASIAAGEPVAHVHRLRARAALAKVTP